MGGGRTAGARPCPSPEPAPFCTPDIPRGHGDGVGGGLCAPVAALAAVACLYVPSAAAEPASTSDPVPPAVVAPTQTEDQTETPTGDEEVAGDTETPDQARTKSRIPKLLYRPEITVRLWLTACLP